MKLFRRPTVATITLQLTLHMQSVLLQIGIAASDRTSGKSVARTAV